MTRWRSFFAVAIVLALGALAPTAALAARAWRAPLTLSAPGADAWVGKEVPSLSVLPNGTAVTAWAEGNQDGSSAIKVLEKPVDAPPVGPQTLGGGANPPSVATTANGRGYVAWVGTTGNDRNGENVLVAERLEGGTYGEPHLLATGGLWSSQPGTAVAANDRGEAVVLFTTGSWNNQQLWTARRTSDGVWHAPQAVADPIGEAVWRLHAGMSETGEAVFAWLSWDPDRGTSAWTAIEPADGPATHVKRMQASGGSSTLPSLAVDRAGNALVAWVETSADQSEIVGGMRAAVRAPGQPFGPSIDLHGSAVDFDAPLARLGDDGHAIVTWQGARSLGPNGASLGGIFAAIGSVPAGVFKEPELVTSDLAETPLSLTSDPVGNAAWFWTDWDTGEARVVRRSVAGVYGQQRAVVPCPRVHIYPVMAAVDPVGNLSLLWAESNFSKWGQPMMLSQDTASPTFSPDPCPAPPPPFVWTPKDPAPGQVVTLDASGSIDHDAASTTFKWDLDGDGTYETDTGTDPRTTHVFLTGGEHTVGVEVYVQSQRPGNGYGWSCPYKIRVGSPPDPPNEYPAYHADPRPPDDPDENPWPVGSPPVELPPLPPVTLPIVGDGTLPPTQTLLDRPGLTTPPLAAPQLALSAPPAVGARTLAGSGLLVRLATARRVRVSLRLLTGHRRALAHSSVLLRARRATLVRLRPTRAGRRMLRAGRVHALTLVAKPSSGKPVRKRIRVR